MFTTFDDFVVFPSPGVASPTDTPVTPVEDVEERLIGLIRSLDGDT